MKSEFNLFEVLTPKSTTYFLDEDATIRQALEKFSYHKFTVVPILNKEGEYLTSLSEGDILRYAIVNGHFGDLQSYENVLVKEIEKYRSYNSVGVDATFDEIYYCLLSQNFVPVVDDRNIFVGIIRRKDIFEILKHIADKNADL